VNNACEVNNINYRNSETRAGFTIFGFIFIVAEMSHVPRIEELPVKKKKGANVPMLHQNNTAVRRPNILT
jgi:hypothetical protein